jgi:hypothetical protein
MKVLWLISIVSLCAAACGPSSSTSGGTQTDVCATYATNYCNRLAACSTYRLSGLYGDTNACIERWKPIFCARVSAPGSEFMPAQQAACAAAYTTASCDDLLLAGWKPAACVTIGRLAAGAPCGDNAQCSTGYCRTAFSAVCGICTALSPSGGTCTRSDDCEAGLGCVSPGTCIAPSPRGASCQTVPCDPRLVCINLICEDPLTLDAACDPQDFGICNLETGLYCDSTTMRCAADTPVPVGGVCSTGIGGSVGFCTASSACNTAGLCAAPSEDGAACDTSTSSSPCKYPAKCIGNVCVVPDPSICH